MTDEKRDAYMQRAAAILRKKHGLEEDLTEKVETEFIENENKESQKSEKEEAVENEKK